MDFPVYRPLPVYKYQKSRITTSKKTEKKKIREREIRLVTVKSSLTPSVLEDETKPIRKLWKSQGIFRELKAAYVATR